MEARRRYWTRHGLAGHFVFAPVTQKGGRRNTPAGDAERPGGGISRDSDRDTSDLCLGQLNQILRTQSNIKPPAPGADVDAGVAEG